MIAAAAGIGFALGLAGSLHCLGMCGPLAVAVGLNAPRPIASQLIYHTGRVATYSALGALAGAAGSALSDLARYEKAAAILTGLLMIAAAIIERLRRSPVPFVSIGSKPGRMLLSPRLRHKFATGLMMGLLPCGMVYAALLAAAGAGGPLQGAITMFAFGAATSAPLAAAGLGTAALSPKVRQWGPKLAPAAVALVGALLIWRGLSPGEMAGHVHHH